MKSLFDYMSECSRGRSGYGDIIYAEPRRWTWNEGDLFASPEINSPPEMIARSIENDNSLMALETCELNLPLIGNGSLILLRYNPKQDW